MASAVGLDHVSKSFGAVHAVTQLSLEVEEGEFLTLLGPSGCVLTGAVLSTGTFSLTGPCDDSLMARHLSMAGTISPYGSNLSLEAVLVIEVDLLVDGVADGEVDCVVDPVNVSGTGASES